MKGQLLFILSMFVGSFLFAGDKPKPDAPSRIISGKVVDKKSGEELAGAEVLIGTDTKVYTDLNGNFSVSASGNLNTATVSLISYPEKKLVIENNFYETLIIELDPE